MITKETLAALAAARARIDDLVDGPTSQIMDAWLNALRDTGNMLREVLTSDAFDKYERARRLEIARHSIANSITQAAQTGVDVLTPTARLMVENAAAEQDMLLATQLPPGMDVSFTRPDDDALAAIIARTTEQITVRSYYLAAEATDAMNTILRVGMAGGINPNDAAERIIELAGPVFNGGLARATVIARTEMLDAHRRATEAHHQANSDILEGWVWMASLNSSRTCISCIAQHGTLHPLDEPGPLDHHQGRCTRLPKTKPWDDLGIPGIPEPPSAHIQTGEEWFNNLTGEQQRKILGPTRYEAWKAGDFPVEAWSERRSSEGWRDAYHAANVPPGYRPKTEPKRISPDDLPPLAEASLAQMQQILQNHLGDRGRVYGLDDPMIDPQKLRTVVAHIGDLLDRYPMLNIDVVGETWTQGKWKNAGGAATYAVGRDADGQRRATATKITLNRAFLAKGTDAATVVRRNMDSRWWNVRDPDTDMVRYIVNHEFGHLLDYHSQNVIARSGKVAAGTELANLARSRGLRKGTPEYETFKLEQMSRYGQTKPAEGIAESFADVLTNGDRASETSRRVVDKINAILEAQHGDA